MGVKFTREQQQVIDLRDSNILVSAAAGSGKTAVLVERIITRLTKDVPPLDVDQLLIVTFTEAAASEMKERIHAAIEKALEEQPDNEHLQRQSTLIHQANITTMHTFCMSVIRDYFHTIGLDPGFRVGEEGELQLLKRDVLETVLESAYQEANPEFLSFVESFASGKDDRGLENLILQLHQFASSYPNPAKWLDLCVKQYEITTPADFEQKTFVAEILQELRRIFSDLKEQVEYGIAICESEDGPIAYKEALVSDRLQLDMLTETDSFVAMQQAFQNVQWTKLGRNKKDLVSDEKINQVKAIRDEVKGLVKSSGEQYFAEDVEELCKDMQKARSHVEVLVNLVKTFDEAFVSEKRKKNLIDFGDMEHYALQILTKEVDGELVPSEVAESYQQKFAEVMIDEYQDSNFLQEAIMTSVSRISKGQYNIFMVGDVKQSIYRFRLSRPELFMEKFHTYSIGEGERQRIDLHKNFRSRWQVLAGTNVIFEQIMIPSFGGIAYDDQAALYVGADYEEKPGNETEVLLVDMPGSKSDERMELEAEVIAERIRNLKENHTVFDKATGTYRKVRFSDIVILTRSPKSWNEVLARVLNGAGIPTYTGAKEGYFQTQEIGLILNYLKILDNPRQDIPFTSVLTSMFAGLSTEELAMIRNHSEKKTMYECVLDYAESGEVQWLKERLGTFIELFEHFRNLVPYTAIHVLLWQILRESGYGDYAAALPGGEQRAANLEMLIEKAVTFEGTSYKGLFNFVRYIEQLEKYEIDYGEANLMDEQMDVVTLMSIHKSKGLEFPIVFVAGLGKQFNTQDLKNQILIHAEWGIGIDCIDSVLRTKVPTLLKKAIQQKSLRESAAEELRVLYVAMTRAKEKLILTGGTADLERRLRNIETLQFHRETQLPYYSLVKAKDFLEWILSALLRNQCFAELLEQYGMSTHIQNPLFFREWPILVKRITLENLAVQHAEVKYHEHITKEILRMWDAEQTYDEEMKCRIEEQFAYQYPYEQEQYIKQKLSVSELKRQIYLEEEGEDAYKEEVVIPLLPKFLQEDRELTGASKGTAYHKLLELLDFSKEYNETSLGNEIAAKTEAGLLTEEMASCIRVPEILNFLHSDIGRRVQDASREGKCFAEQPFVLGLAANHVYPNLESEETVLVQGIIDVYFEEDGQLVVLDYKTDRVHCAEELKDKYHAQLDYYAKALERLTGKTVKEKMIYSFTLQKEIQVSS